jgi:hypothetical protein
MFDVEDGAIGDGIPAWVATEPEWASALHLLTSPTLQRKGVMGCVDFTRCIIEVPRLRRVSEPWSAGERALLRAACDLFNGGGNLGLATLLHWLDDDNLRRVLEAIEMRRGWRIWPVQGDDS